MTAKEKKIYLLGYKDAVMAEKELLDEIEALRSSKIIPAVVNDGMPHAKGGTGDLSGYAAEIDKLWRELQAQVDKRIEIRRKIISEIEAVGEERYRVLLRYRYILLYPWEKIMDALYVSEKTVYRWHGEALKRFEKR